MAAPVVSFCCVALFISNASATERAHYAFDGDFNDSTPNAKHATPLGQSAIATNSAAIVAGNGALSLDGANASYLTLPAQTFSASQPWSAVWWAKRSSATGDKGMVMGDSTNNSDFIWLNSTSAGLRFRSSTGASYDFEVAKDTGYHHYALVANGAGGLSLYVDGAFVSNKTGNTAFVINAIGKAYDNSLNVNFSGFIDEARIFDHAVTAQEVSDIYQGERPPAPSARYPFNGDMNDTSGNARHGTAQGQAASSSNVLAGIAGSGSLSLDGTNASYVSVPSQTFAANQAWTVVWWARRNQAASDKGMIIGEANGTADFIWLNHSFSGFRFRSSNGSTQDFVTPKDTEYHHYALVANGAGGLSLYVDGALIGSRTTQTAFVVNAIGKAYPDSSAYNFQGQLDEVQIFAQALNATRVSRIYQEEKGAVVHAYYAFDGDFRDRSGNAVHATSQGSAAITTATLARVAGTGALALDGANANYVGVPAKIYPNGQPWSVVWWARRGAPSDDHGMIAGDIATTNDFIWLNSVSNGLRFRSSTGASQDFTVPKDTAYHHYALVADGANGLRLYVDGDLVSARTANTAFQINAIGKAYPNTSAYNFGGSLDEVRIANVALSAANVSQIYQNEKGGVTEGPVVTRVRVVLIGGQSNADGRADPAGLPTSPVNLQLPQDDVSFYVGGALTTLRPLTSGGTQFGPEITLGRKLADLYASETGTRVALVKYAVGGSNLYSQWKAGGDATITGDGPLYVNFQNTVNSGLAALRLAYPEASVAIEAMVWFQGESDAVVVDGTNYADQYQVNLTRFIADVRATFPENMPFVIGRLSLKQTALDANYRNTIRAAQNAIAAADPRVGIIDTDTFGMKSDNLHFDAAGQQSIGSAFAAEVGYFQSMMSSFSPSQIDQGLADPDADPDEDGISNHQEFIGGSNPLSRESAFRAWMTLSDGQAEIRYSSSPARNYRVEKYDPASGQWDTVLPTEKGASGVSTRGLGARNGTAIYRVRAEVP